MVKSEAVSRKRKGKREYLNDAETRRMMRELNRFFESKVDIPLIRHGKRQRIEILIDRNYRLLCISQSTKAPVTSPIMIDS